MGATSIVSTAFTALLLGAAGAFLWYGVVQYLVKLIKLRHIPGPVPLPLIGNLYDPEAPSFIKWLSKLRKNYGKVFRVFTFSRPYVVLIDKQAAREVLSNPKVFPKGPDYPNKFGVVFGQGLVTSEGDKHKADRALFQKYFNAEKIRNSLPAICEMTLIRIEKTVEEHLSKHPHEGFNLEHFFHELTARFFCKMAINHNFEHTPAATTQILRLCEIGSSGSNVIGTHIVLGVPVLSFNPAVRKMLAELQIFYRVVDPIIDARMKAMKEGKDYPDDTLTAMVNKNMPRQEMYDHLATMLTAGQDTTSYACCYCIYLLAKNPEIQQRVKREVKRVLGNRTDVTWDDYENLAFVRNCIQEALRLYAVVPHVTRMCVKETALQTTTGDSVTVPAGVEVLVPFCLLNRDTDEWDTVEQFNPDRFEGVTREWPKKGYFPFAYGTRSCIGAPLALMEGTTMLSLLFQKYTFKEDPDFKLALKSGTVLVAAHGVNVLVERDTQYATMSITDSQ